MLYSFFQHSGNRAPKSLITAWFFFNIQIFNHKAAKPHTLCSMLAFLFVVGSSDKCEANFCNQWIANKPQWATNGEKRKKINSNSSWHIDISVAFKLNSHSCRCSLFVSCLLASRASGPASFAECISTGWAGVIFQLPTDSCRFPSAFPATPGVAVCHERSGQVSLCSARFLLPHTTLLK